MIIQKSKELKAEMKSVTSEFDKNDQSQEKLTRQSEVLTRQIDNQRSRVSLLEMALDKETDKLSKLAAELYDAAQAYGENSDEASKLRSEYMQQSKAVSRYQTDVNNATSVLNEMERELDDVGQAMAESSKDSDKFANALDDIDNAAESSGDGFTVMKGALANLVSGGISGAVGAVKDLAENIVNLAEETEEYRTMQAKMSGSAESFGYSVQFAKDQYKEFYEYLGDEQMSTNAITNLMGMQVSTDTVTKSAEAATAVWTAYGDSIPIESLTESINESAQVAQVTGVLADALNWAGISEDNFNTKLQSLTTTQERADLIAQTLNDTYGKSKETYDDMTEGIRNANDAEAEFQEIQAEVGEAVEPVRQALTKLKSNGLEAILPVVEKVGDLFEWFGERLDDTGNEINDAIAESKKFRDSMKDTVKELEKSSDSLEEIMEDMENSGKSTEYFVDSLEKLSKNSERTADQQYELEAIVTHLNNMFPDLALSIDQTTGSLNKSTDEIREYIKEAENTELAVEAQGKYEEAVKNLTAAEEARTEAMNALSTVTADRVAKEAEIQAILDAQTEKTNTLKAAQDAYSEALRTGKGDIDSLYEATLQSGEAMVEYNGRLMSTSEALMLANQDLNNLVAEEDKHRATLETQDQKLAESKAVLDEYSTSLDNNAAATGRVSEANTGYQEVAQLSIEDVSRAMEAFNSLSESQQQTALDLESAVSAMEENIKSTIQSQMDMFSQFDASLDLTTQDLLNNMQSQVDGVTQWGENITALSQSTIDDGLLAYLRDMGPEGAGYVSLFASMSEDELAKANELWDQAMDIQGLTTEWGQELLTTGAENIAAGMDGINELLNDGGSDGVMGFVEGVRNALAEAEAAGVELGESFVDATNEGAGVNSPSWKTKETGQYLDQGLVNGIKAYQPRVLSAAKELASQLIKSIGQETGTSSGASTKTRPFGTRIDQGLQNGITSGKSTVINTARNLVRNMVSSMENGINSGRGSVSNSARNMAISVIYSMRGALPSDALYISGYNVSIGLANGIYAGGSAAVNAAASVAASAINAARSTLQIHSPSRVFWDMGDNAVNAFASGFMDSERKVAGEVADTLRYSAQNAATYSGNTGGYENIADSISKAIISAYKNGETSGETTIVVDGDTIILDGKAIGKSATKYITSTQMSGAAAKGRRARYV